MNKRLMAITGVLLIALLILSGSVLARRGPGHPGRGMGMTVGQGIPEALGLSIDDYIKARREGKSITELAEAQGLTLDALKAKLLDKERTFIEEGLAAGRFTEAKAAYMLEAMEERVDLCLQGGEAGPLFGGWGRGQDGPGRGGMGMAVGRGIPEALGLSIDDYVKARREGKSISELAEAQGLTLDDLKAKLVEEQRTLVEEELAAGRISEAKAAYMLEVMEEQVDLCLQDGEAGPLGRCPYWGAGPRGGRGGRW